MEELKRRSWDDIPEEEPDEWDLRMLEDVKNDPECHDFITFDETVSTLGLDKHNIIIKGDLKAVPARFSHTVYKY